MFNSASFKFVLIRSYMQVGSSQSSQIPEPSQCEEFPAVSGNQGDASNTRGGVSGAQGGVSGNQGGVSGTVHRGTPGENSKPHLTTRAANSPQ